MYSGLMSERKVCYWVEVRNNFKQKQKFYVIAQSLVNKLKIYAYT